MPVSRFPFGRLGSRLGWPAALLAVVLVCSAGLRGDGTFSPRAQEIGKQLICTCGCQEGALTCSTLDCTVKLQMQAEIRQRALSPEPVSLILQSFVQEYGTQVLANPTKTGFNRVAWVMQWVGLAVGALLLLFFLKRWRRRPAPASGPEPAASAFARQVEADLDAELNGGHDKPDGRES